MGTIPLRFFKTPSSWIAVCILLLFCLFMFPGFEYFAISLRLTYIVLFVSTTSYFTIIKQKREVLLAEDEVMIEKEEEEEGMNQRSNHYGLIKEEDLSLLMSESECGENQFASSDQEKDKSLDLSDGSISDEESLIEISLPTGHYVGHSYIEEEDGDDDKKLHYFEKKKLEPNYFSSGYVNFHKHHSLVEILAEINHDMYIEEENMIEIDLSIGSIKYTSRFEIEA